MRYYAYNESYGLYGRTTKIYFFKAMSGNNLFQTKKFLAENDQLTIKIKLR
jgi:hypothetical protein